MYQTTSPSPTLSSHAELISQGHLKSQSVYIRSANCIYSLASAPAYLLALPFQADLAQISRGVVPIRERGKVQEA